MRLVMGGSPCTHWSIAQTKNRETEPSGLGWDLFENYLFALDRHKADYFLYENNKSMSAAIREEITKRLGVEPICINSALVSAQNRQRLYWTNIPGVKQPEDRGILLRDVLESGIAWREKGYTLKANHYKASSASAVDGGHFPAPMVAEPVFEFVDYDVPEGTCLSATHDRMRASTKNGSRQGTYVYFPNADKSNTLLAGHAKDEKIFVPVRIGTIESEARNQAEHDSKQYRVYSPDGKSVTLCGQGGGVGAKTGLYATPVRVGSISNHQGDRIYSITGKSATVMASPANNGGHAGLYAIPCDEKTANVYEVKNGLITIKGKQYPIKLVDGFYIIRKLTVRECMRLQTVPERYEFPVSNTQAYKMLGNGWTVDVIAHILSYCPRITTDELDVLSMYDGMACGHLALDKLGANITRYRATEIDKYAIKTACHNFPDVLQLGDAFQVRDSGWK